VLVYCHAGCAQSAVLDSLRERGLWPPRSGGALAGSFGPPPIRPPIAEGANAGRALNIWNEAVPATGSLAERYLRSRNLTEPLPPSIRFHPALAHPTGGRWPAMIAAVYRWPAREVIAVHRTFLREDGGGKADVAPARMALGTLRGGYMPLALPRAELAVAEGIETALSVQQSTGIATWATLGASNLPRLELPPLPLASEVVIAADADSAGVSAALKAADRWHGEGRRVRIAVPPQGRDFNDLLIGAAA